MAEFLNIILVSLISVMAGLQLLTFIAFVYYFIPIPMDPNTIFMPEFLTVGALMPEREISFYRMFVLSVVALQAGGLFILRSKLTTKDLSRVLLRIGIIEGIVMGVAFFTFYKMLVNNMSFFSICLFYF